MAAMRGLRSQVGNASWIADERAFALKISHTEAEEFSYSARNELDWLNEHMAGIFDENETNFAETFKTPGKLRGKTPRTGRKPNEFEPRVPLSDVFGAKPKEPSNTASQPNEARIPRSPVKHPNARKAASPPKQATIPTTAVQDSGYFGSQGVAPLEIHMDPGAPNAPQMPDQAPCHIEATIPTPSSPSRATPSKPSEKPSSASWEENETGSPSDSEEAPNSEDPQEERRAGDEDHDDSPASPPVPSHHSATATEVEGGSRVPQAEQTSDDVRSPSDGSSPIRPVVRKSSLNFASLPAREPLTAGKSIGTRVSRTSHLDQIRTSYYNRPTGGKSLGNLSKVDQGGNETSDEMDLDGDHRARGANEQSSVQLNHTKTYTQRLQDQISMLGKSQSELNSNAQPVQQHKAVAPKTLSPERKTPAQATPGAFPDDETDDETDGEEDDDWVEPAVSAAVTATGNPALSKSHSADVMEAIHDKGTIGQHAFNGPRNGRDEDPKECSPEKQPSGALEPEHDDPALDKASSATQPPLVLEMQSLQLAASVSNPELRTVSEMERLFTPSKSPSRSFRDSPLKQVKNKLSSILKSSRGLLASSAAVSAEGKSSMMPPSVIRPILDAAASTESVISKSHGESQDLHAQHEQADGSPARPVARRTRASADREKEEKRREKEAKRMEAQNDKLQKAREKEREKALVYSREQERIAAMERQISTKKTEDNLTSKETPKPTRSSPRRLKAIEDGTKSAEEDVDMGDAPSVVRPPSASRHMVPGQPARNKETKRPIRPAKEALAKVKQAPTVIRVNTGSQHSQLHTSTRLSTASHDTAGPSGSQSQNRLLGKSSTSSMRAPSSAISRAKALDMAAKKREMEEREAQRRREVKAEMERKRAAAQEEQRRQEGLRRQEAERQRQHDSELAAAQNEGKTPAQRRAALEMAKQTRAPPPAARSQPNGEKAVSTASNARGDAARPQSRMVSTFHRSQDEPSRPVNAVLSNASKPGVKRALGTDRGDESQAMRAPSRGGPSYQANEAKRRRTSDTVDDEADFDHSRNIKGPPVRPSGGFKKDLPPKSMYGYANAPPSASRDLFKATVTAQLQGQTKAAHPLDMAQISKGAIPFAPTTNLGGAAYKTPARPGANTGAKSAAKSAIKSAAKSAARSSPRFQNGESIELPEIQTDDDDEDEDEANGMDVAAWADSPDLRRALMRQETMDPSQIFGPPAPLNMEEVFNKSKDRWHKFRARTSSANWGGVDRLTEEDIRKDLAARDKLRREGGWSYEMSREML